MSKYSEELKQTFPTMKELKQATRDVIKGGGDLAFKEYHDASSFERIKKEILK